jgi:Undecaprenyl-phosphate galactose phosphotransferase WbaP
MDVQSKLQAATAAADAGVRPADTPPRPASVSVPRQRQLELPAQAGILLLSDIAGLLLAAATAYLLWPHLGLGQPIGLYVPLLPLLGLFPLIFAAQGLYPGFGLGAAEVIRRLVSGTSLAFVILAGASFVLKIPPEHSRVAFALAWLLSLALLPAMRFVVLTGARRFDCWGEPTVVIGNRAQVELTLDLLRNSKSLGYRVVGALCSDHAAPGDAIGGVPIFGGADALAAVGDAGIRTALVWGGRSFDSRGRAGALNRSFGLDRLQKRFRHVVMLRGNESLPVEHVQVRNLGTVFGIEFSNELLRRENRIVKRTLDILVGSLFLLLSAPVILICGLLMRLVSRGPIFFTQEREGLGGRNIRIWKLRTMYEDAERRLNEHLESDAELRREWDEKCKLARDPRVVRGIGTFLRRFSIDELPQLWCVVTGAMSLVGPRPLPDYHLRVFRREFMELRQSVRPGVTGLWQITVRNVGGLDEHQRYDSYYIRNWSVWLDLYILARTVAVVLAARGAF